MKLDGIQTQPVIQAETLVLRPLRVSDMGLIEHYGGDQRVANMTTSIPHPYPPGAAQAFVQRAMTAERDEDIWALDGTCAGGPEFKGVMSLKQVDQDQSEVGYWTAPMFWNTGVASEALEALIAANPRGDTSLVASTFQENLAAARVLTHCGFKYLGDGEKFSVARDATVATFTYLKTLDGM